MRGNIRVRLCAERDNERVANLLDELKRVARGQSANITPITVELVKARASMGDIIETLKRVWGTYRETPVM